MQKRFLKGIACLGLLAVLPACHTQKQAPSADLYAIAAGTVSTVSEQEVRQPSAPFARNMQIPQLQVDAQSVYNRMITYITPDEELAPKVSVEKLTAYIDFPANGIQVNPKYGNNRAELAKFEEHLKALFQSAGGRVKKIRIMGYASPDGNTKENERLAGNRAIQFKNYLQKQLKMTSGYPVSVDWVGEDWEGLQRLIAGSDKKYIRRVLSIFQLTDDPDSRRKQIKAIDNGAVYKDIEKTFFARLRRMELAVETESETLSTNDPQLIEKVYSQPEKVSLTDFFRVAALYRPGTEQYREIYEIAAYTYPSCLIAQLNAGAAALAQGDTESARYFLNLAKEDRRACNNLGVLALMDGDKETAAAYFRKYMPQNPRVARANLGILNNK